MYYQATPTIVLMKKFRVQRHAHALYTVTIIIEQASLAISMSILNYFKKASSPRIDPEDKGDSDIEVPALTTSGITQGA